MPVGLGCAYAPISFSFLRGAAPASASVHRSTRRRSAGRGDHCAAGPLRLQEQFLFSSIKIPLWPKSRYIQDTCIGARSVAEEREDWLGPIQSDLLPAPERISLGSFLMPGLVPRPSRLVAVQTSRRLLSKDWARSSPAIASVETRLDPDRAAKITPHRKFGWSFVDWSVTIRLPRRLRMSPTKVNAQASRAM